jgi:hypothetical protein
MDPIQIAIIAAVALLLVVALTVVVTRSRGEPSCPRPRPARTPVTSAPSRRPPPPRSSGRRRPPPHPRAARGLHQPVDAVAGPPARSGALGNALLNVLARGPSPRRTGRSSRRPSCSPTSAWARPPSS